MVLYPTTIEEAAEAIRANKDVLPIGAQTKPRLSSGCASATLISSKHLAGITEYHPSEFTFTALGGTPIKEVTKALGAEGQFLPFEPLLTEAGSTLGGMIAGSANGPGRVRFGGIRDFILGLRFVDGRGTLLRSGAKVVKNAAGFDVPKFLVGSLGRFGMIVEVTFKVFPRPEEQQTLRVAIGPEQFPKFASAVLSGRWEASALEYDLEERAAYVRLAGSAECLTALSADLSSRGEDTTSMPTTAADWWWRDHREFTWTTDYPFLLKVPTNLRDLPSLFAAVQRLSRRRVRVSGGGTVVWCALPDETALRQFDADLETMQTSALVWRGSGADIFIGKRRVRSGLETAIQQTFDPESRFAPLQ